MVKSVLNELLLYLDGEETLVRCTLSTHLLCHGVINELPERNVRNRNIGPRHPFGQQKSGPSAPEKLTFEVGRTN